MPGNKRTVAAIVRALSARKQADFASPARTGRLTSSATTRSIKRSHIRGPPTLPWRALSVFRPSLSMINQSPAATRNVTTTGSPESQVIGWTSRS